MGRAPGTALAFMYWCRGFQLMEGHSLLTRRRACHPKLAAIRAATCDMLFDQGREAPVKINLRSCGWRQKVQVGMACSCGGLRPDEADGKAQRFVCRCLYRVGHQGAPMVESASHVKIKDEYADISDGCRWQTWTGLGPAPQSDAGLH